MADDGIFKSHLAARAWRHRPRPQALETSVIQDQESASTAHGDSDGVLDGAARSSGPKLHAMI